MMFSIYNPAALIDAYKYSHRPDYPKGTNKILVNFTARKSRLPGVDYTIHFGLQAFCQKILIDLWENNFFSVAKEVVVEQYERRTNQILGPDNDVGTDHIAALWDLGYLPLRIYGLPEGSRVPIGIPSFLIENTHPDFYWLPNYIESIISAETWQISTTATQAYHFRELLDRWAKITSDAPGFVDFQGHDFSFRGMPGLDAAAASGAAHLLSFAGSDTIPSFDWIEYFYYPKNDSFIAGSVPATEHSVMCAGGQDDELETFRRIAINNHPKGIVSIVSDTWKLYGTPGVDGVIGYILPTLKDEILKRDGKVVIRPDSGDPVDILCGTLYPEFTGPDGYHEPARPRRPFERKTFVETGVIECLWDIFGGTINSKGYKELDPHIGAIYGDSITYERAQNICARLEAKGFASTNVVFGIGSFTYQHVTRDTFGSAMKATWAEIDGVGYDLFKDPETDSGMKKSAKGRLAVHGENGKYVLIQGATPEDEEHTSMELIWEDGDFVTFYTWEDVVAHVGKRTI